MRAMQSLWTSRQKHNAICLIILTTLTPILSTRVPFTPQNEEEPFTKKNKPEPLAPKHKAEPFAPKNKAQALSAIREHLRLSQELDDCDVQIPPPSAAGPGAVPPPTLPSAGGDTPLIALDAFCHRQFDDPGVKDDDAISMPKDEFMEKAMEVIERLGGHKALVDGYAPFCKHIFIPNFTDLRTRTVKINEVNKHLIVSAYERRSPKELPVLIRSIDKSLYGTLPVAKYLDLILYSREQIIAENKEMGNPPPPYKSPWGLISIKAQDVSYEQPMTPITMMRNALGKAEGGSGVPLDRDKYEESVTFWNEHVQVQDHQ